MSKPFFVLVMWSVDVSADRKAVSIAVSADRHRLDHLAARLRLTGGVVDVVDCSSLSEDDEAVAVTELQAGRDDIEKDVDLAYAAYAEEPPFPDDEGPWGTRH